MKPVRAMEGQDGAEASAIQLQHPIASHHPSAHFDDDDSSDVDDRDSAIGSIDSLLDMDTASLQSDIMRYRYENGRRYHSYHDGAYWGPNDEIQNDENDISHHLWRLTLDDKLFLAPICDAPQV